LDALADDEPWRASIETFALRHPRRRARLAAYEALVDEGEHQRIAERVLAHTHRPAPPVESWLNKADGRKKRVFSYPPADELLFRTVNRLVQPAASAEASPWCRSFLPGGGPRTTFRHVVADAGAVHKAALRLDVRDYFNSIDIDDLLARLPESFTTGPLGSLLRAALTDQPDQRGVMAGTPLAPLLSTLYLRDLDHEVAAGATYARYSDDILVLASPADVTDLEALIRARLAERNLRVNEGKTGTAAPGAPWDFLGFRFDNGRIGLAPITVHKFRARTTRRARSLLRWRERKDAAPERALSAFLRRTNRRLYGPHDDPARFSWGTWFLPMLHDASELRALDAHVQREARYVATGRRTPRARARAPYAALVRDGYLPLVSAYWAGRESLDAYDALVARRTSLAGELLRDDARQRGA
jgi:hypothetical protein